MESINVVNALAALAQETRLAIYRLLVEAGPTGLAVGEIGASVKAAPATLSFHLKELANAKLLSARQEGRYIFYSANYAQMNALIAFLTDNCCARDGACRPASCSPSRKSTQRSKA
jgi:DNA-binding transcriptional ArsR family regulator